jgi:AraC-like DNA-binding protein/mannose-6-phosphate isomerase-like protein (cupin superfamily)
LRKQPRSTNADDYQHVPRPVAAMLKRYADGHRNLRHRHERGQLVFAITGVMSVATDQGTWVVPPNRAVWMPAGVMHQITMSGEVEMRTLYIRDDAAAGLPASCTVVSVTPLLRELIIRATELPVMYDEAGAPGRVIALLLDEIRALPALPLELPMPSDRRLASLCTRLLADPAARQTLDDYAKSLHLSSRTLARLFQAQTGMTFGRWRQQARLFEALKRIAAGSAVTAAALDVGYESASAFSAMFRRKLGMPPSHYFA